MFGSGEIDDFHRIVGCSQDGWIKSKLFCLKNVHDNQKVNM